MRHVQFNNPPAAESFQPPHGRKPNRSKAPRCPQHPGVHMVLAGTNPGWNTVRYLCPMCSALGLPPAEMAMGVVSAYFADRGYGFIENGGPRVFFHISDLAAQVTPYVGMPVTCRVEQNEKGLIGREVAPR